MDGNVHPQGHKTRAKSWYTWVVGRGALPGTETESMFCIDAAIGEVHTAHAGTAPTGEQPGEQTIYWCEGVKP